MGKKKNTSAGDGEEKSYKIGSVSDIIMKTKKSKKLKLDSKLANLFKAPTATSSPLPLTSLVSASDSIISQGLEKVAKNSKKKKNKVLQEKPAQIQVEDSPPTSNIKKKEKKVEKEIKLSNKDAAAIRVNAKNKFKFPEVPSKSKSEDNNNDDDKSDDNEEEEGEGTKSTKTFSGLSFKQMNAPKEKNPELESRTVYIGNLPSSYAMKKAKLKILFKKYGTIETIRFRGVTTVKPGGLKKVALYKKELHPERSNLTAYIRFETRSQAEKAAKKLSGKEIEEHRIIVDLADSNKKSKEDRKTSIFVGNLDLKLEEDALWKKFEDCGKVKAVRIIRDAATGLGKGFGYVNFKKQDSVVTALLKDGDELNGRPMRVKKVIKKEKKKKLELRKKMQEKKNNNFKEKNRSQSHEKFENKKSSSNMKKPRKTLINGKPQFGNQRSKNYKEGKVQKKPNSTLNKKKVNKGELKKKIMAKKLSGGGQRRGRK